MAPRKPSPLTIERYAKLARGHRNSDGLTRDLDRRKVEVAAEAADKGGQVWPPTHDEEW